MSADGHKTPAVCPRHAELADAASIAAIEQLSFEHVGERFGRKRVASLIKSPRMQVLVAEMEQDVIGWCAGFVWARGREPWGRIYALAVHPSARGRRIGDQLLVATAASLRGRGAGKIFLEVHLENHSAVRLYEKHGFVPCRLLPNYYGPGRPAQRMVKAD